MLLPMKEKANIGAGHSAAAAGYTTIAGRAVGEYEEKKSRFIASLAHVETEAEALAFLEGEEKQSAEYAAVNARLLTQLELLVEAELPTLTNLL